MKSLAIDESMFDPEQQSQSTIVVQLEQSQPRPSSQQSPAHESLQASQEQPHLSNQQPHPHDHQQSHPSDQQPHPSDQQVHTHNSKCTLYYAYILSQFATSIV